MLQDERAYSLPVTFDVSTAQDGLRFTVKSMNAVDVLPWLGTGVLRACLSVLIWFFVALSAEGVWLESNGGQLFMVVLGAFLLWCFYLVLLNSKSASKKGESSDVAAKRSLLRTGLWGVVALIWLGLVLFGDFGLFLKLGLLSAFTGIAIDLLESVLPAAQTTDVHVGLHGLELTSNWFGMMARTQSVPLDEIEPRLDGSSVVLNSQHVVAMGAHAEWERQWWVDDLKGRIERRSSEADPEAEAAMKAMLHPSRFATYVERRTDCPGG